MPGQIRVVLLDDHVLTRQTLAIVLESQGIAVVQQAAFEEELKSSDDAVDIVVIEPALSGDYDEGVITRVRDLLPTARIVVVTRDLQAARSVPRAMELGADGFLSKRAPTTQLVEAIHNVALGMRYVEPALAVDVVMPRTATTPQITPRETEVLRLVAAGYTNAETAQKLGVGLRTVEAHRANACRKLDLHTRADIVRYVQGSGA